MAIAVINIDVKAPMVGIKLVKAMPNVVPKYCCSELSIDVPHFNGDSCNLSMDAHFVSPSGREIVRYGFYDGCFKVRFAPTEIGTYSYYVTVTDGHNTFRSQTYQFTAAESNSHGFVQVSTRDPHYLEFDDGTPFSPIGVNAGWWFTESYVKRMKEYNISLFRVWMCSWHINIEPKLGNYSELAAKQLDNILALAEKYDVYIQLVLLAFTDFAKWHGDHWRYDNPYNAYNGGPCEKPVDFLTNPEAKRLIKRRFNYILNRWGSNPRIAIWELWNEVDIIGGGYPWPRPTDSQSKAWHEEMAQVFRENDTYRRPLATSCSGDVFFNQTFSSDAIDIIQIHTYKTSDPVYLAELVGDYVRSYLDYGKPVIIGEYGLDASYSTSTRVEHLSNGLWVAAASGSAGSSMWWYSQWNEITDEMLNRYLYFANFVRNIPWPALNVKKGVASVSSALNTRVFSVQGDEFALAWVQHIASEGTASGAKLTFSDLSSRAYTVHIYNDSDGTYLDKYYAPLLGEDLTVDLPNFTRHLAVKVTALEFAGPVAKAVSDQRVELGKTVTFDASGSLPGWNGTHFMSIISYYWNFGDGETGTGMIINHTYTKPGVYNVTLTVLDEVGDSDTTPITLNVEAEPVMLPWLIAGIVTAVIAASIALYFLKFRERTEVKT